MPMRLHPEALKENVKRDLTRAPERFDLQRALRTCCRSLGLDR